MNDSFLDLDYAELEAKLVASLSQALYPRSITLPTGWKPESESSRLEAPFGLLVVIMTKPNGVSHDEIFRRNNPALLCATVCGPDDSIKDGDGWRNPDRTFRNWWIENRNHFHGVNHILLVEYDVVINCDLLTHFGPALLKVGGMAGRNVKRHGDDWAHWGDIPKLKSYGNIDSFVGIAPFAVVCINREAFDHLCQPKYDAVYREDILSEFRTPTLIRDLGYPITELCGLQYCEWHVNLLSERVMLAQAPLKPDLWHPVKFPLAEGGLIGQWGAKLANEINPPDGGYLGMDLTTMDAKDWFARSMAIVESGRWLPAEIKPGSPSQAYHLPPTI